MTTSTALNIILIIILVLVVSALVLVLTSRQDSIFNSQTFWSGLGSVAALFLVILTIISVIFAYYQYRKYEEEKKPNIILTNLEVKSNIASSYPILHPSENRLVSPSKILELKEDDQRKVEECLFALQFMNTGAFMAKDVEIEQELFLYIQPGIEVHGSGKGSEF